MVKKKRKVRKGAVAFLAAAVLIVIGAVAALIVRGAASRSLSLAVDETMMKAEYGVPFDTNAFVKSYEADSISAEGKIDTSVLKTQHVDYILSKNTLFGKVSRTYGYDIVVQDSRAPEIMVGSPQAVVMIGESYDPVSNVISASDPVDGTVEYQLDGTVNTAQAGEYPVTVQASDKNGNIGKTTFTVRVVDVPNTEFPFYVKINRAANTVTVYMMDSNGEYSIPVKAMVCSTGTYTPTGVYQIPNKYKWLILRGDVWGQYATRIYKSILFHSVPYFTMKKDDLEYEEYNKLGTSASLGCIRLCVLDAKWIFDNCKVGTTVELYDDADNPGPLGKPVPLTIDVNSPNRGWDPTDPDPANPWK